MTTDRQIGASPLSEAQAKAEEVAQEHMIAHAQIIWHDGPIALPERHGKKMSYSSAQIVLARRERYEEEYVQISERFEDFPLDAALAFHKAMARTYGWVNAETVKTFFGAHYPSMVSIPVSVDATELVPMGRFTLPGLDDDAIDVSIVMPPGEKAYLEIEATVKRKFEPEIRELLTLTKKILKDESIYRGKAFKIRFTDDDGDDESMPVVSFIDTTRVNRDQLILNHYTARSVAARIWTPIERAREVKAAGVKLKRGALLAGPYGTGKTLTAYITAQIAVNNGWTFLYCEKTSDLARCLRTAAQYPPAVLFCEDLDRITSGRRNVKHDELLNILDGVDTKEAEVMVVFTTNHQENIGDAFLRPGRIDVIVPFTKPDAQSAERLVRLYAGESLAEGEHLEAVGKALEGRIPAVIEEVVASSKLYGIQERGYPTIFANDLLAAAASMQEQMEALEPKEQETITLKPEEIVRAVQAQYSTSEKPATAKR